MKRMKGQFFIIGALFICVLLFFGTGFDISMTRTETEDMKRFSENLLGEVPHALNIGINITDPIGVLYNFTVFSIESAKERRMELKCFWVVFSEDGGDVNVTVGNFLGQSKGFGINVSGDYKNLQTGGAGTNSSIFSAPGYKFNVTIGVDGETSRAVLLKNKTSIYLDISLERDSDVVKKELLA